MPKINILAIPPDSFGVGKFRILNPYSHLQENHGDDFHIDIKTNVPDNDREFDNYDIIVLHSFIHNTVPFERNIQRIEWLKRQGKIVIVDIDDYWTPDMRHPLYLQIIKTEVNKKKIALLQSASYVSTTTPIFKNSIMKSLGIKNVVVFPNAIDETEFQYVPKPIKSDKIRFGWLGGSSHLYDIELMKDGISATHDYAKDKVQFVLCGFDLRGDVKEINKENGEVRSRPLQPMETVWYKYEQMFTKNYSVLDLEYVNFLKTFKELDYDDVNKPYRRRWTKDVSKYATNYNYFDVSLAPIVNHTFNNNKSQLKVIEAGFFKKALIASESNPYLIDLKNTIEFGGTYNDKGNALLVSQSKNHKQWFQHMKRLIDNPNMIEDLGNKLYETVHIKYSLSKVNNDRAEFFRSIVKK